MDKVKNPELKGCNVAKNNTTANGVVNCIDLVVYILDWTSRQNSDKSERGQVLLCSY